MCNIAKPQFRLLSCEGLLLLMRFTMFFVCLYREEKVRDIQYNHLNLVEHCRVYPAGSLLANVLSADCYLKYW